MCTRGSTSVNGSHLRSETHADLAVSRSKTKRYGQRCFAVSGPTLWNTLPPTVHDPSLTLTQFCALLKTVLFCRTYKTLPWRLRDYAVRTAARTQMFLLTYLTSLLTSFCLAVAPSLREVVRPLSMIATTYDNCSNFALFCSQDTNDLTCVTLRSVNKNMNYSTFSDRRSAATLGIFFLLGGAI